MRTEGLVKLYIIIHTTYVRRFSAATNSEVLRSRGTPQEQQVNVLFRGTPQEQQMNRLFRGTPQEQ